MDKDPIASLDTLRKNNMDVARFGACAERVKKGIKTVVMGCDHHDICPWARVPTEPVEVDGVVGEPGLRPRNKKYVIVTKGDDGHARVRESWCSCFEWHENFAKKHGMNDTVIRVTGDEGATVTKRGSKRIAAKEVGQEATWETLFWKEKVPVFAPHQSEEFIVAKHAEEIIRESGLRDEQESVRQILGGDPALADVTLELSDEEVRRAIKG
ncbi:MAG TPA: hypothetical protein VK754_00250 [Propionibacteriaceae bacterium]|nr:hypothetical protein [Propionibacteriaceae bacterium]